MEQVWYAFPRRSVGTRLSLYLFPRSQAGAWEREKVLGVCTYLLLQLTFRVCLCVSVAKKKSSSPAGR